MGLFNKTKLGFEPLGKIKPVKVKGRVVESKMLNYKFTIPEGYELTKESGKAFFDGSSYSEFRVEKGTLSIEVIITPMQGEELVNNWEQVVTKIQIAILQKHITQFDEPGVTFVNFIGRECAHCKGVISNRAKYAEEYIYSTPYMNVAFMAISNIDSEDELLNIFDCFKRT